MNSSLFSYETLQDNGSMSINLNNVPFCWLEVLLRLLDTARIGVFRSAQPHYRVVCSAADSTIQFGTDGLDLIRASIDLNRPLLGLKSKPSIAEIDNRIGRTTRL